MTKTDKLFQWLDKQTKVIRETLGTPDPEVMRLRKMVGSFGCQSHHVAELVAIYTGKPVRNPHNIEAPKGAVVVVMKRERGHNYSVGKPAMSLGNSRFLSFKRGVPAFVGNPLPVRFGGDNPTVRPATTEEVAEFMKSVGEDAIKKHLLII